jgi:DNA-binding NtrC family response regulator
MQTVVDRLRDTLALMKLVGQSPCFLHAIQALPLMAKSEGTVLIRGETGTGKELAARAVHYLSPRAGGPFVGINCGSLPDTLLEDELFGHERGAFTDAQQRREGVIAQAAGGTLFLDEVDSLTRKGQVCLLRLVQERQYRPIGGRAELQADVRLVVATNADLDLLVAGGAFRADLFYRLSVFLLHLPALRDRQEDVLPLAAHFLKKHAAADRAAPSLSPAAAAALLAYRWPGNVRELENTMLRACHLSQGPEIEVADLGLDAGSSPAGGDAGLGLESFQRGKQRALAAFEIAYLVRLMAYHKGNISHAALAAGKERRDLGRLLLKHHINPAAFR